MRYALAPAGMLIRGFPQHSHTGADEMDGTALDDCQRPRSQEKEGGGMKARNRLFADSWLAADVIVPC
ncbi:MAG TPA: hypothetical protein VFW76_10540, partial [Ktedonobacterales bacterium]|nr:hypothetical protein [Ktedonobacterales bacterium]